MATRLTRPTLVPTQFLGMIGQKSRPDMPKNFSKGPSLDAIRRFKQQQEEKKREDNERRIKEKLSTLEHRASQGDRKAKQELKKLEQFEKQQDEIKKRPQPATSHRVQPPQSRPRSHKHETDFEELMKLAKQNNNEIRILDKPQEHKNRPDDEVKKDRRHEQKKCDHNERKIKDKLSVLDHRAPQGDRRARPLSRPVSRPVPRPVPRPVIRHPNDYDQDEDDSDLDDFVVDDEEEDVQAELSQTLKSVFRYDKRRCDLREAEIDRQYRAIGNVRTFEDLEREERRASRLAAAEDARAQREEDERKRLKRIRLNKDRRD